jgi:RNA polymerase sigma-70 factor (ECF subfamily)
MVTDRGEPPARTVVTEHENLSDVRDDAPDAALVRATLAGDERAFGHLVRRYLRRAMAVAMEYTRTREDAEDVVQDTFTRVLDRLDRFDADRPFAPWFFTILRNTARNAATRADLRAHDELATEHPASQPDPLETTERRELSRRLDQAIAQLPAMQQTCFRLCLVEGLSSAEAAAATGLAESTVRVHVFRARQALQERLSEWRETPGDDRVS